MKKFLIILSMLAAISCDDDTSSSNNNNNNNVTPECGNGIAEGDEDCDGDDLRDYSCADVVEHSDGTLGCSGSCTFVTAACVLPEECGDGFIAGDEECDGNDLDGLTCQDMGDFSGGSLVCNDDCTISTTNCEADCSLANWEECNNLGQNQCCDHNEMPSSCMFLGNEIGSFCLQTCNTGSQCGFTLECNPNIDVCLPSFCGGAVNEDEPVNAPCMLGDKEGFCFPQGNAMEDTGICMETGSAQHGEECMNTNAAMGELLSPGDYARICDGGLCVAMDAAGNPTEDGTCLDVCDPVALWQALSTADGTEYLSPDMCPEGSNCFNVSSVDTEETDDDGNPNPSRYFRTADMGICYPMTTGTVSGAGLVTCNLLNSTTVKTGGNCGPQAVEIFGLPITDVDTTCQIITTGSLIGACQYAESEGNRVNAGESCDPAHGLYFGVIPATECAEGSVCQLSDPLNDSVDYACMVPCSVEAGESGNPSCDGMTDAGGSPYICASMTIILNPAHELPVMDDNGNIVTETSPSPLGLCVPPVMQ